jgi:hypothetical protein
MKGWHVLACAGLVAGAGLLVAAVGGGGLAVIPFVGCALMMGAMVWMMTR